MERSDAPFDYSTLRVQTGAELEGETHPGTDPQMKSHRLRTLGLQVVGNTSTMMRPGRRRVRDRGLTQHDRLSPTAIEELIAGDEESPRVRMIADCRSCICCETHTDCGAVWVDEPVRREGCRCRCREHIHQYLRVRMTEDLWRLPKTVIRPDKNAARQRGQLFWHRSLYPRDRTEIARTVLRPCP